MATQERYFICWVLPEPVLSEIETLKQYIAVTYHTKTTLKSPAHITLIPPFLHTKETELLQLVQDVAFDPFPVHFRDYGAFPPRVVYVNPEPNQALQQLYLHLSHLFYKAWPAIRKNTAYDFHPHVTIGNRDWSPENFEACWNEMKHKTYKATATCEKLSLLKLTGGKWTVL